MFHFIHASDRSWPIREAQEAHLGVSFGENRPRQENMFDMPDV